MTEENLSFTLPTGEPCDIRINELNHNVAALQPVITLNSPVIPNTCFQHIAEHICNLNRPYINSIYFDTFKFKYRVISFNLFGHVRSAFKKELKKPIRVSHIISNTDNYNWIESGFLPKLSPDIDKKITLHEKKLNCFFIASNNGNINNTPYTLTNETLIYNHVYDLHPTDLIPIFSLILQAKLNLPPNTPDDTKNLIEYKLLKMYHKNGIKLKLI